MLQPRGGSADILQRLKAGTADLHERVEQRIPVLSPGFVLQNYAELLGMFYGYWAPLEEQMWRVRELHDPALGLETRLKSHLLERDLRHLGIDPGALERCGRLPDASTFGRGLGCMYVLEGSTLGGRIIARHLRERFGLDETNGASFYNAYGEALGERWTEFRRYLLSTGDSAGIEEAVAAARETFERLDEWLARPI